MKAVTTLFLCLLLFAGCKRNTRPDTEQVLTITIEPLRYLVQGIAGDRYTIQSMIPQGGNPETYEPKPSQIGNLQHSRAYFHIGQLGFEKSWLNKITKESPHLFVCNTSEGIEFIGHDDHSDPHIWASPQNMSLMASHIYNMLCTIDRANSTSYQEKYEELQTAIHRIDDSICSIFNNHKFAFMVYHPTLSYFARDYGLKQIAIEEHGKEPSARRMKDLIAEAKKYKIKSIFVQKEFDTRYAELIAQEVQAKIIPIDPLSANWEEEMIRIAHTLKDESATD